METNVMTDAVTARIKGLDADREYRALAANVAFTSPVALELMAYEHLSSPTREAQRVAAIQLRVITDLASKLRWLENVCLDVSIDPGVRTALAGVLVELSTHRELMPGVESDAALVLEPAMLFHLLLANLRPWIPPMILSLEPESTLELLQLGIPDYLHPLLVRRYEAIWALFHRLRQLPAAQEGSITHARGIDAGRIEALTALAQAQALPTPPAPRWHTPEWVSPWLSLDGVPQPMSRTASNELAC